MNKEINAEEAFDCIYYLLQRYPWLIEYKGKLDASVEHEAVAFLLQLAQCQVDAWGDLSTQARITVSGLLVDFMIKLRQPDSVFRSTKWYVAVESEPWQQALTVIDHEIRRSFPPH